MGPPAGVYIYIYTHINTHTHTHTHTYFPLVQNPTSASPFGALLICKSGSDCNIPYSPLLCGFSHKESSSGEAALTPLLHADYPRCLWPAFECLYLEPPPGWLLVSGNSISTLKTISQSPVFKRIEMHLFLIYCTILLPSIVFLYLGNFKH